MDVKAPKIIQKLDYRIVANAHMGSDGYIWGKDPMGVDYISSITSRSVRNSKQSLIHIWTFEHVYLAVAHVFQL